MGPTSSRPWQKRKRRWSRLSTKPTTPRRSRGPVERSSVSKRDRRAWIEAGAARVDRTGSAARGSKPEHSHGVRPRTALSVRALCVSLCGAARRARVASRPQRFALRPPPVDVRRRSSARPPDERANQKETHYDARQAAATRGRRFGARGAPLLRRIQAAGRNHLAAVCSRAVVFCCVRALLCPRNLCVRACTLHEVHLVVL